MNHRIRILAILLSAALLAGSAWADDDRGFFGLSISVDGEGAFWNPVLKAVTVVEVETASPAAAAGIVVGDRIIEVAGKVVAGARANELEPLMKKKVGEQLQLRVQRESGEPRAVTLTAILRPR